MVVEGQVEMLNLHWFGKKAMSVGGWTRCKHTGVCEREQRSIVLDHRRYPWGTARTQAR